MMKILHQLFLHVFLFFMVVLLQTQYMFGAKIVPDDKLYIDAPEKTRGVELSFDKDEKGEELKLHSASEKKDDNNKTIKELKNNIQELHSEKKEVTNNFQDFIKKNGKLKNYFKEELTDLELSNIENILELYHKNRKELEVTLKQQAIELEDTGETTRLLLELRKELYISFLPYIQISKLNGYTSFIKVDVSLIRTGKDIQSDIYKKQEIVSAKVSSIKEKIQENQQKITKKLNEVMEQKIEKRLLTYKNSEKFQGLSLQKQKDTFIKVLHRVKDRRLKIEGNLGANQSKKIALYIIVERVLEKIIVSFEV